MCDIKNPVKVDKFEAAFIAKYGSVYESSPWVAKDAYAILKKDHADLQKITETMKLCVDMADLDKKMELLKLHPQLADRVAIGDGLTHESHSEQTGAGLTECTETEFALFGNLNEKYYSKFGFPFIIAVAGKSKSTILNIFQSRLSNSKSHEFNEAIFQVHLIAKHRLEELFHVS